MEALELIEWFCVTLCVEPSDTLGRWRVVVTHEAPRGCWEKMTR